jgi:hypothetical protein
MTVLTGAGIDFFRMAIVINAIKIHIKHNGAFRLTRMATPSNLRAIATEYTGKVYPRSRKGLEQALVDLEAIKASANE